MLLSFFVSTNDWRTIDRDQTPAHEKVDPVTQICFFGIPKGNGSQGIEKYRQHMKTERRSETLALLRNYLNFVLASNANLTLLNLIILGAMSGK